MAWRRSSKWRSGPSLSWFSTSTPDMHGVDVLKFLRSHAGSRAVPVIVLTTRGDEPSRDAAMSAGATFYLTKPFAPQTLLSTVEDLLRGVAK